MISFDCKKWLRYFILLFCIFILLLIGFWAAKKGAATTYESGVSNLRVFAEDSRIHISWATPIGLHLNSIELTIRSNSGEITKHLNPSCSSYEFTEGTHGQLYYFMVQVRFDDGHLSAGQEDCTLFWRAEELPDLPLLSITTTFDEDPSFMEAERPEGCWGHTITNNDYHSGTLDISHTASSIHTTAQIKVRGNTSAFAEKTPYKIKLDQAVDLLSRNDSKYNSRYWVLIDDASFLRTIVGTEIARQCGIEWQPSYAFVNVVLNGDWKGCYLLMEAVEKGEGRCNINDSGYILENDVYWWNADDIYFRTAHQIYEVAYTFQYPCPDQVTDSSKDAIKDYITEFETALYDDDEHYSDYIDLHSWAAWLLVHDIMGTSDAGGANIFLYKYDLNQNAPNQTKLKMGPLWDFGSSYEMEDTWANVHEGPISDVFYYPQLLKQESFVHEYKKLWYSISDNLAANTMYTLEQYYSEYGTALQESRDLEATRTGTETENVKDELTQVSTWLSSRIPWLNDSIASIP